jgi:hypothetical protein
LFEGVLLAGCMVFAAVGTWIRTYEGIADPREIIERFGDAPPSNDDFFDNRITDLAVATNRNSAANDKTAWALNWASICLFGATLVLTVMLSFPAIQGILRSAQRLGPSASPAHAAPKP